MTDRALVDPDSLRAKYRNIRAALPDIVVVAPGSKGCFHRQDGHIDEPHAMCRNTGEWVAAEVEDARLVYNGPCKFCFEAVLDDHTRREDSPVAYRNPAIDADTDMAILEGEIVNVVDDLEIANQTPYLTSIPNTVLHASESDYHHAPTEGGPLCGCGGDYRRVAYDSITTDLEPCSGCFSVDALAEPGATEPAIADD